MLGRYVTVGTLARSGDEASGPAILITAAALGEASARAGLLVAALTASTAAGGPVIGALIDRARRPRIGYALGLLTVAAGMVVIAAGIRGWPLLPLVAAGLLAGLAQPIFIGGWTAQLSWLVPAPLLKRAYALDVASYDLAGIIGPAIAAAVLAVDDRAPVALCALLFLAALPALALCRVDSHRDTTPPTRVRDDVVTGLRTVMGQRALRRVTVVSSLQHAGLAARTITAPLLALHATGHASFAGVLIATAGAASLGGSLLLSRIDLPVRPITVVFAATGATAACLATLAFVTAPWALVAVFAVCGLVDAPLLTSVFAVRGEHTSPELRARVFSIGASLKTSAYAGGAACFGLLAGSGSDTDIATVLLAGAGVQVLGLLVGWVDYQPRASAAAGSQSARS